MSKLKSLCVFCGSSSGTDLVYRETAEIFGRVAAQEGIRLIYGGGRVGLMGTVADAALKAGGHVIGVIPEFLATRELLHENVTEMHVTHNMHERKAAMAEKADGFIALPGGLGTFEELFEVLTWSQLGLHQKPIGLLNVNGYFDPLVAMVDRAIQDGFCRSEHRELFVVDTEPVTLLQRMRDHRLPTVRKWIQSIEQAQ